MKYTRFTVTVLIVTLGMSGGMAFDALERMRIHADFARFRGEEQSIYVEIYYSIPQRSLTYVAGVEGFRAEAEITMVLMRGDSMMHADRWAVPHTVSDELSAERAMNLVGVAGVLLPEGEYRLKMIARDRNEPSRVDSVQLRIPVAALEQSRLALSDIELAVSIRQGGEGGQFYKNTLEVIPNVEGVFSEEQKCFIYAEAYNLLATGDRSDYLMRLTVYDAIGREVISREKPRKRSGESSVIVDNIVPRNLKSGTYMLVLSLLDSSGTVQASSARKFFIYNKSLGVDSTLVSAQAHVPVGVFAGMEESELDREAHYVRYEMTDAERVQYRGLQGVDAKRKFLSDFWGRKPAGYRAEYLERVAFANRNYQSLGREGYLSDRGRVHIMYGPPDDYDRRPSDADARPYEIWTYHNIQGGVMFLFVQRLVGTDYDLVHSTHRNEIQDENWARILQQRR